MEFKDYYRVLGVPKTADADEIKKSFRKLARKYHPDVSKEADAAARMSEINEAHAVLSDPERRAAYDALGTAAGAREGRDFQPPPQWAAGFDFGDLEGGADAGSHSDFFEQLFGRAARGQASGPLRGSDQQARIELDLLDAYTGAERMLTLHTARRGDDGRVVDEERQLQVQIPKGLHEGQHIRLAGRGGPGFNGGAAGDLLLEVHFSADPRWHAEGRNVVQRLPLAPWEAQLGGSVHVHTPGGETEVAVPAGWKPGRRLRLKGRGLPAVGSHAAGDLFLALEIALPPATGEAERAAYAALAKAFPTFDARRAAGA